MGVFRKIYLKKCTKDINQSKYTKTIEKRVINMWRYGQILIKTVTIIPKTFLGFYLRVKELKKIC